LDVVKHFRIDVEFLEGAPYGTGHINDTYVCYFRTSRGKVRYLHQKINNKIFRNVEKLMENIERVTVHLKDKIAASGGDPKRGTLNIIPAADGKSYYRTDEGDYWRTYVFIEGARTYDLVEHPSHVYSAARAFGEFQKMLTDIPGERLFETIPDFHNTRKRFEAFEKALKDNAKNRVKHVKPEIDFIMKREKNASVLVDLLEKGMISERVTHNDTKFNNVMIDDKSGEGVCVIDLDTVMPGLLLYDFGESVRIMASTGVEDEEDLSKVGLDISMFERLADGYLSVMKDVLTPVEADHMVFSSNLLTFENGMRFLTDYLNGDVYFKVRRKDHNLIRCRTQFKMVSEIENRFAEMDKIIRKYL